MAEIPQPAETAMRRFAGFASEAGQAAHDLRAHRHSYAVQKFRTAFPELAGDEDAEVEMALAAMSRWWDVLDAVGAEHGLTRSDVRDWYWAERGL